MYILFDIGATKMRIARAANLTSFDTPVILDTPPAFDDGMRLFAETAKRLAGDEKIIAIAGGITGSLSADKRMVEVSPHLPGWAHSAVAARLEDALGAKVYMENDSAIVGLGEVHAGAGKGYPICAYITVSTGVGGARFVDGLLDRKAVGFEPGQIIIDADGNMCPQCEKPGTIEHYVSGTAVEKRFGKKPYEIPQDSPLWNELAEWLSIGLSNIIMTWSPDAVVLGGSMMVGDPAISTAVVRDMLGKNIEIFRKLPEIKRAELGAIGGIHGALVHLTHSLEQK
jgi:predicted NBD/HSP70 family sugar kinase